MSNADTVPPAVEQLLLRYLEIQENQRQLDEEKARLRDQLAEYLRDWQAPFWHPVVGGQPLKVRVKRDTEVVYQEELLRQRLGERYALILRPDPAKLRKHLTEITGCLQPVLDLVGSPHRDAVRDAIGNGTVRKEEFAGAYEKKEKVTLAVMRFREEAEAV
jgi:hypothetical protein